MPVNTLVQLQERLLSNCFFLHASVSVSEFFLIPSNFERDICCRERKKEINDLSQNECHNIC